MKITFLRTALTEIEIITVVGTNSLEGSTLTYRWHTAPLHYQVQIPTRGPFPIPAPDLSPTSQEVMYSENRDSSVKRTPLQRAGCHRMWTFAHSSRLRRWTAVRLRPRWGRRACRWASLRRFVTICAEILWLCKPIVAAAVRVAGLRQSWRWRCWMWRSWVGVVTRGLRLWGRLDVQSNSLKRLMVEKLTFNSRATIQHANCTLPQNLQHLWHWAVW